MAIQRTKKRRVQKTRQRKSPTASIANRAAQALRDHRVATACELFQRAIAAGEESCEIYSNYSAALYLAGTFDAAESTARHAVDLDATSPEAWSNLGISLQAQGRMVDAVKAYREALSIDPTNIDARINLALAHEALGDLKTAGQMLVQVATDAPEEASAQFELGRILVEGRHPTEALPFLQRASELDPQNAVAANALGVALRQLGRGQEALRAYRTAVALQPDLVLGHINLSRASAELGYLDEAVEAGRTALRIAPNTVEALNNLASALRSQGHVAEAASLFETASKLTGDPRPASNRLCAEQYRSTITSPKLRSLHEAWSDRFASNRPAIQLTNDLTIDRKLRIGFSSPDLGQHPVGFFLSGVLDNLDPARFETICYSDRVTRDSITSKLSRTASHWRETGGVTDEQLLKQIRRDNVDILIDLAGHTRSNRLGVFAERAAPVQASWLGYVGTTGVPTIDYVIADRYHVPLCDDQHYTETIARMPAGYLCYEPPTAPPVENAPSLRHGFVTFGAFHNPAKISSLTVDCWAEILVAVPDARLLFKYWGFDSLGVKDHVRKQFATRGVESDRLKFRGASSLNDHLRAFADIDLMLDPQPYSGGLTTCESVWMGVPVITMPGQTFAGRHATSHMTNAGFPEFVADSSRDYVGIAVEWANKPQELAALRQQMRQQVAASPLCDTTKFSRQFGDLMHELWAVYVDSIDTSDAAKDRTVA